LNDRSETHNSQPRIIFIRIIGLSGISILSGAILIPLAIGWYIRPPLFGYLTSILALILLVFIQLGVQKLRYNVAVKWQSVEASFTTYLRNSIPTVIFSDVIILFMIIGFFLIDSIRNIPLILLLCANGITIFSLGFVLYLLKTTPRLPRRYREMKTNEHPRIWELVEKSKIKIRSIGFLDYGGLKVSNAFQWGTGSNSIIALTDELEKILDEEELTAITAHELGHVHYSHFSKLLISSLLSPLILVNFVLLYFAYDISSLLIEEQKLLVLVFVGLLALGPPFAFIPWLSRRWEMQADLYAASLVGVDTMTSALRKLVDHNIVYANIPKRLEFLISHPILETRLVVMSDNEKN
jgi:STE24 endopeptidase